MNDIQKLLDAIEAADALLFITRIREGMNVILVHGADSIGEEQEDPENEVLTIGFTENDDYCTYEFTERELATAKVAGNSILIDRSYDSGKYELEIKLVDFVPHNIQEEA